MAVWNTIKLSNIKQDRFDAEYFRKDYLENLNLLKKTGNIFTLGELFGYISRGLQPKYSKLKEIKVLRSVNVGFLDFNDTRQEYVTTSFLEKNTRGKVQKDDILITSTGVGTLGRTSIWNKDDFAFCDGHITILRNSEINPYLIALFLNTSYGLQQFDQNYRGSSGQIEIYPFDISKIIIPEILFAYQNDIGYMVQKSFDLKKQSQALYKEAEELLEKELGLDGLEFEKPRSYTAKLSEVYSHNRCDADFYQTKFRLIEEHIGNYGFTLVKDEFNQVKTSFSKNLEGYNYIEIGDINISNGLHQSNYVKTKDLPANAKINASNGDLLVSTVRPYRGAVSIIDTDDLNLVVSGAFTVLREKDSTSYKNTVLQILLRTKNLQRITIKI